MDDAARLALESQIRERWRREDPRAVVEIAQRDDGKLALTIVSSAFHGTDSFEREALVWPVMRDLPGDVLVQMSYSLLLTPDEADGYFDGRAPGERTPI